jgi:hypothetical protein
MQETCGRAGGEVVRLAPNNPRADGDDPSGARDLRRTLDENTLEKLFLSWWTGWRILVVYRRLLPDFSYCDRTAIIFIPSTWEANRTVRLFFQKRPAKS